MRILILGGSGMLGHVLYATCKRRHDTRVTLRKEYTAYQKFNHFAREDVIPNLDVSHLQEVESIIQKEAADVVVNCIGIIKQSELQSDPIVNIEINALLPHQLAKICSASGSRFIHLSTDCVFSGRKGDYRETDEADPLDLYGRTKLIGEVTAPNCLTLRTSMIGPELEKKESLLEWFLAQTGPIEGYQNAIFSGFTTFELSRIIESIIVDTQSISGLYHVSSKPISKFDLLCGIRDGLGREIDIIANDAFKCNRSLNSDLFKNETGYAPPEWSQMIIELCNDMRKERT